VPGRTKPEEEKGSLIFLKRKEQQYAPEELWNNHAGGKENGYANERGGGATTKEISLFFEGRGVRRKKATLWVRLPGEALSTKT